MAEKVRVRFLVNGEEKEIETFAMARLLDVLREDLRLTGVKEGCGEGECGACSVFLNGELVNSCLVPLLQADAASIITVECLGLNGGLDRIQAAFLEQGAAQCGICTPGMILAALNLLEKVSKPSEEEIREALAGNLCRCTGYGRIVEAVKRASVEPPAPKDL